MIERTIDLQAIQARIEDCASYNFGMRDADQLAHVDAPDLLVALGQAEAERDGLLAMVAKMTVELEDYQNDSDVGDAADYLLTILTTTPAQSLTKHDAEVAAKAIEDAGAQYSEYEAFIASDGHMSLRRHDKSVDEWLRDRAAEYRKTETEGK